MNRGTAPSGETEFRVRLRSSNPEPLMSALGQKQTLTPVRVMSALPPKADIAPCENLGSPTEAPGPENFNILDQETRSI